MSRYLLAPPRVARRGEVNESILDEVVERVVERFIP